MCHLTLRIIKKYPNMLIYLNFFLLVTKQLVLPIKQRGTVLGRLKTQEQRNKL